MTEISRQHELGSVLVEGSFVSPLRPDAMVGELNLEELRVVTDRMTATGYEPTQSVVLTSDVECTLEELALRHLFSGGEERSALGYQQLLRDNGKVIGPFVNAAHDGLPRFGLAVWNDLRFGMRRKAGDVSWGILGAGTVGARVIEQLKDPQIAERSGLSVVPDFVLRKSGLIIDGGEPKAVTNDEVLPDVDLLFVATPGIAGPDSPAYRRIVSQLERRGLVVTAEKASLAEHFAEFRELSDDFARMGINATVGGGTRLIDVLGMYTVDTQNVTEIHLALNGTLSFIMGQVANGEAAGVAVDQAVALGYAEPGASGVVDVMIGEATGDIPRKIAVVMNALLLENPAQASLFAYELDTKDIRQALREAGDRRFVVSVYNRDRLSSVEEVADNTIGGFCAELEQWVVVGGFQKVRENPLTREFADHVGALAGATIGLGPQNQDGVYSIKGPGAGPKPTANTMLDDAQVLIAAQRS